MHVRYYLWCLIGWIFVVLMPLAAAQGHSETNLTFIEGRYFEVVGTDYRSVSFANTLGTHVIELCASYLVTSRQQFSQPIVVTLRPPEYVEFDGNYQLQLGARSQVRVDFRWDASLQMETMCHAFAEAYILQYVNFNYGPDASDRIRFWPVSALGVQSYLSLRPAQQIDYIREVREAGVFRLSALLDLDRDTAAANAWSLRQGYWVLRALRQHGFIQSDIKALLGQAVVGHDVSDLIQRAIQPITADQPPITLEAWWQSQMLACLSKDYEYYDGLDRSRAWIEALIDFEAYRAAGGELNNLMDLWVHRSDEALRAVIKARREIIILRIERVNPAYFNAAQSLGALYETTLAAEHTFEFIHAMTSYLTDWEDSKRLHDETHQLLNALSIQSLTN